MFTTSLLVRKCKQKHASFFGHTCASSAAASKRKSSLNGNDKNAATVVSADSAKAKGASGPTGAQSPAPVAKKQRMTKKQKIEQEKKKVCMLIVAF